ncbi:hypothetical protein [Mycobacterium hubeiense]|uniref:hypothetical protein n=1 Tax=Mycobacterium hubeiense TaxID=1867256 RepID=UPI001156F9F1|nr:hypothetical protein [Mycobacterium sp. QGD 101]
MTDTIAAKLVGALIALTPLVACGSQTPPPENGPGEVGPQPQEVSDIVDVPDAPQLPGPALRPTSTTTPSPTPEFEPTP